MLATRSITFILHRKKEARRGLLIHTQPEPSSCKWGGLDAATQYHIKHSFATSRLPINVYILNVVLITLRRRAQSRRKRLMRVLKISSARSSRYAVASVVRGMSCQVSSNRIKHIQVEKYCQTLVQMASRSTAEAAQDQ